MDKNFMRYLLLFASAFFLFFENIYGQIDSISISSSNRKSQSISNLKKKSDSFLMMASKYHCSNADKSIEYIEKSINISNQINDVDALAIANLNLGKIYFGCNEKYEKALMCFQKSKYFAIRARKMSIEYDSDTSLGGIYFLLHDYKAAESSYRSALLTSKVPQLKFINWLNIVECNLARKKLTGAIVTLDSALGIWLTKDALKDTGISGITKSTTEASNLLLDILEENNLMADSIAFKINKVQANALQNYKQKIKLYLNALDVSNIEKDQDETNGLHLALAQMFYESGLINFAGCNIILAEKDLRKRTYLNRLPSMYTMLGKILISKKDYLNAERTLDTAIEISRKIHSLEDEKEAWMVKSTLFVEKKEVHLALNAYHSYTSIQNRLDMELRAKTLALQDIKDTLNYHKIIAELQRENSQYQIANAQKTIRVNRILSILGLLSSILFILLSYFIYKNYRSQKKLSIHLLREKTHFVDQIKIQGELLADVAQTHAHDLRGPLSTIIGLSDNYNFENPADPENIVFVNGINDLAKRLDAVIIDIIKRENSTSR